jgi:hypothetical protein
MRLFLKGTLRDHHNYAVPYKLVRDQTRPYEWWICQIDPHMVEQFTSAGFGKNHATATRNALAWWKRYDEA